MKRKILFLSMCTLLFTLMFSTQTVFAVVKNDDANEETKNSSFDFKISDEDNKNIDDLGNQFDELMKEKSTSLNWGLNLIRDNLVNVNNQFFYLSSEKVAKRLLVYIKPIAFLIMFIAWIIGLGNKAINLDLFDGKQFISIGVSLIIGVTMVLLADKVCALILSICDDQTKNIIGSSNIDFSRLKSGYVEFKNITLGKIPIIGPLLRLFFWIAVNLPAFGNQLLYSVVAVIINCIISIRVIKLAIYTSLSPAFFGLAASKSTIKYFENFIIEFIITTLELLVMGIVFVIMVGVFTDGLLTGSAFTNITFCTVMMVFVIMMFGAHKYIARLFGRS